MPPMPVPKYHQVYLVLREQLHEGHFSDGLPGEMRADAAVRRGARHRAQGAGALADRRPDRAHAGPRHRAAAGAAPRRRSRRDVGGHARLDGLLENLVSHGPAHAGQGARRCDRAGPAQAAEALRHAAGASRCKRRCACARPARGRCRTSPPACRRRSAPFGRRELAKKPILMLLEESGVQVGRAHAERSRRAWPTPKSPRTSMSPWARRCWRCAAWSTTRTSRPVQWLLGLYRPDRYEYRTELLKVRAHRCPGIRSTDCRRGAVEHVQRQEARSAPTPQKLLETLAQKLIANACGREQRSPGEIMTCEVDLAMFHDSPDRAAQADAGRTAARRSGTRARVVLVIDHHVPERDDDSRRIVRIARDWARDQAAAACLRQPGHLPRRGAAAWAHPARHVLCRRRFAFAHRRRVRRLHVRRGGTEMLGVMVTG